MVVGVFKLSYHSDQYSSSIIMCSKDRFVTPVLVLLAILACGVSAKYKNYGYILESADYRKALAEALALLTPEKLITRYTDKVEVYADDEIWQNSNCNRDLLIMMDAVLQRQLWALKSKWSIQYTFYAFAHDTIIVYLIVRLVCYHC